jgi:hypothetical protein
MSGTFPNLREHIAIGVFDMFQNPYSAVEREHEDAISRAVAPAAIGAVPKSAGLHLRRRLRLSHHQGPVQDAAPQTANRTRALVPSN